MEVLKIILIIITLTIEIINNSIKIKIKENKITIHYSNYQIVKHLLTLLVFLKLKKL